MLKRLFDFFSSLTALIFLLPFFFIVALLIAIEGGFPVFFTQTRIGKNKIPFQLLKFRTMVKDADKLGLNPNELTYFGRALTANGEVRTAPVRLDTVAIGPYNDRNLPAVVNAGDLGQSLLGMNYLQRWSRIEISDGTLTLSR